MIGNRIQTLNIECINQLFLWGKVINEAIDKNKLNKVQRLVAKVITVAIRSTPQEAVKVMLDLQPLELFIKHLVAKGALK